MGIPIGWNIVRDEAKEKDVLRADVTGSRSPIRRRARGSRPPRNLSAFDTDALVQGPGHGHTSRFANNATVVDESGHAFGLSHARTQLPPPPPPVPEPELRGRDVDREDLPPLLTVVGRFAGDGDGDVELALPALTPGFAPAGLRPLSLLEPDPNGIEPPPIPFVPAPIDLDAPILPAREREARPRRLPPRASPPRPTSGRRIELDLHEYPHLFSWSRPAPYARPTRDSRRERDAGSNTDASDDDEAPGTTTTTAAVSHPLLRRVGHRRIADGPLPASSLRESWSPVSTVDGLGDRERSNSVSSTSSNSPWPTFLSTVIPDPVAPTAESSFASSAASASFAASSSRASSSNSNSAASSLTHVTVPSRRPSSARRRAEEAREDFARACESSDEGDSTASDTEDEATANPLSRRRVRAHWFGHAPPRPRRQDRSVMEQGLEARRHIRSYWADITDRRPLDRLYVNANGSVELEQGRENENENDYGHAHVNEQEPEADSFTTIADDVPPSTSPASPLDQELRDARNLLERLAQRGDVGDDFWASVGLTRSFADGVERVQERGRF